MYPVIIKRYREGANHLVLAIDGLSVSELNAHPVPGTWSIQQIVFHMIDSDLIATDRMKRVIAEDNPMLIGFNESRFATNLFYEELDPTIGAEIFRLNRLLTASLLERLPEQLFERPGEHNEAGRLTLGNLLQTYVEHLEHHMSHVRRKRELLDMPMAESP